MAKRKRMRYRTWIIVFGILDILTLEKLVKQIVVLSHDDTRIQFIQFLFVAFLLAIIGTGILLIKNKSLGYYLSFAIFPIRLIWTVLSFSFLFYLNRLFETNIIMHLTIFCVIMEIGRLVITILAFRSMKKLPGHNIK